MNARLVLWPVALIAAWLAVAVASEAHASGMAVLRTRLAPSAAPLAAEQCHAIIPALPQEFERIATFRGYTVRGAEFCFDWEGGRTSGRFELAASWSNDECTFRGSGQSTLSGTFSPKRVEDRIVGGSLKGAADSGTVTLSVNGLCDDDKRKVTNDTQTVNIGGATWEGNVENGILFVTLTVLEGVPVLMTGVVMPPGGIEALGALGQGPVPAIIATLVGLIPPEGQGSIVDELLREMTRSGARDLDDPAVLAKVAEMVGNALLTGGANPSLPSPEALAAAAAAGLIPMAVFTALQSALGAAGAAGGAGVPTPLKPEEPVEIAVGPEPPMPTIEPEEVWLGGEPTQAGGLAGNPAATTKLIADLNKHGIPTTVVLGPDGTPYVQVPDSLPGAKDTIYITKTVTIVKDGVPQDVSVVDSPIWMTHWPKDVPAPAGPPAGAAAATSAPTSGGSTPDAGPPAPDDTPTEPEPVAPEPPEPATPPTPVTPPRVAEPPAPAPAEPPGPPPSGLAGVNPEEIRQRLRDNQAAIDKVKDNWLAAGALEGVVDLLGLPPELNPLTGNPAALTDQQLRDALAKVDVERIRSNLPALRKALGAAGMVLDEDTTKKGSDALDALERFLDPSKGKAEAGTVPERSEGASAPPTSSAGIPPVNAVDNVGNRFGAFIPQERLAQAYNTRMIEYPKEDFDAGYRIYGRGEDPEHVNGFVLRAEGHEPHVALREGAAAAGTTQHEAVHLVSNPAFRAGTSGRFNEAVTEYFSRQFTGPAGIDTSGVAYHKHGGTDMVQKLVDLVGEDVVKRAYFGEGGGAVDALRNAVDSRLGPGQFDLIQQITKDTPNNYDVAGKVLGGGLQIDPRDLPGASP